MSFRLKLSISFIVALVVFWVAPTYYMCRKALFLQKEDLRNKIVDLVKLSSYLIDGDKHSQIEPRLESQGTALYKEMKAVLTRIRDTDSIIESIYTMVKTNKENVWMFVVDSGNQEGVAAYCGERYDVSDFAEMKLAFQAPSVDKELTIDKWGVWLSGYSPIYNSQGEAVAIVGLDVSVETIQRMQSLLYQWLFTICFVGIGLSFLVSWLLPRGMVRSLHDLINGVREVEQGNFRKRVKVRKDGEVQQLAQAFNKMTRGIQEAQSKLQKYYLETIKALADALEAKDHYTRGHSERVKDYAVNIAKRLGFSGEDLELLADVCILHDIGKIGIPERILTKPSSLNPEEWEIVKRHPSIGQDILQPLEFLRPVLFVVGEHHERPDGKGYPRGLKADEIPLLAAIVSVADAFDAMTSDRPYRKAYSKLQAISILRENKNTQFNSEVVDALITYLKEQV